MPFAHIFLPNRVEVAAANAVEYFSLTANIEHSLVSLLVVKPQGCNRYQSGACIENEKPCNWVHLGFVIFKTQKCVLR